MSERVRKRGSLITDVFTRTEGDRIAGARILRERGVTQDDIDSLTDDQFKEAFGVYQKAHGDRGLPCSHDLASFRSSVRQNLREALKLSKYPL